MRHPVAIYCDFESCIQPLDTCQPNPNESYTNKKQKHKPLSFCIVIKWVDDIIPPKAITYTAKNDDKDAGQIFVDTIEKNVKRIYKMQQEKIKQFKFIKNVIFTTEDKKIMNLQLLVISARKNWVKIES